MKEIFRVNPDLSSLEDVLNFADRILKNSKIASKEKTKTLLLIEETFVKIVDSSDKKGKVTVIARRKGDLVKFKIRCSGNKLDYTPDSNLSVDFENMDAAAEAAIRQMILNANSDNFSASYKNGVNTVRITSGHPSSSAIKKMLISLAIAVVAGLLLKLVPDSVSNIIDTYILVPVKTLFMNGLKMIVGPLVFFSIAASVSSFSDLRELGKTGGKVIIFYTFTTVVAVLLSVLMFNVIDPGITGQLQFSASEYESVQSVSILDTITGIVPDNFISAFSNSDTLQIIFLAIIFGLSASMLGKSSAKVSEFLSCGSELVVKVAEIITSALPVMIFTAISHLILTTDMSTIQSIGEMIICIVSCDLLMVVVYCILVFILGKKNPFSFMRDAIPAWFNAFALSSSNASMSFTMDVCDKRLKIDKSIYSFSIPLGATINMDGLSVMLTFSTLFFAKMCGMPLSAADILPLVFTVVVLSFGAPGLPGVAVLCVSVLFEQFGIPMECVALFVAADAFLDPVGTANNVFGDIVGTYIIAARSKLIHDKE